MASTHHRQQRPEGKQPEAGEGAGDEGTAFVEEDAM